MTLADLLAIGFPALTGENSGRPLAEMVPALSRRDMLSEAWEHVRVCERHSSKPDEVYPCYVCGRGSLRMCGTCCRSFCETCFRRGGHALDQEAPRCLFAIPGQDG